MKRILFIIAAVIIVSACTTTGDAAKDGGPVKDEFSKENTEKIQKQPVVVIEKIPLITKESVFFNDGFLDKYTIFSYSNNGILIKKELFDSYNESLESTVYEYKNRIKIKGITYNNQGKMKLYHVYTYTENGLVESDTSYNKKEEIQSISKYSYDTEGNKTKWSVYDQTGILLSYTAYLYENGKCIKINIFDQADNLKGYFIIVYDDKGDKIGETQYSGKNKVEKYIEFENKDGFLIKENHFRKNGSLSLKISYNYNENGDINRISYMDKNNNIKDYLEREYEYREEKKIIYE